MGGGMRDLQQRFDRIAKDLESMVNVMKTDVKDRKVHYTALARVSCAVKALGVSVKAGNETEDAEKAKMKKSSLLQVEMQRGDGDDEEELRLDGHGYAKTKAQFLKE